jgi:putative peptide zinc metalloprotease protein
MSRLQDEIDEIEVQVNNLLVRSPRDGIFAVNEASDMLGRFVDKGELIGYVIDLSDISVRVVVSQRDVDQVRRRTRAIEVRLASDPGTTVVARGVNEVPQATTTLPSALLGSRSGGDIAVDARDTAGLRTMVNIFQFDVLLSADAIGSRLGQRAYVRFVHLREPLGISWYRQLRQVFLSELGI